MNKAFVREPEFDGRAYCPQCGSLGTPVQKRTLDHHLQEESSRRMGDSAWFCVFAQCDVAYFDLFESECNGGRANEIRPKEFPALHNESSVAKG